MLPTQLAGRKRRREREGDSVQYGSFGMGDSWMPFSVANMKEAIATMGDEEGGIQKQAEAAIPLDRYLVPATGRALTPNHSDRLVCPSAHYGLCKTRDKDVQREQQQLLSLLHQQPKDGATLLRFRLLLAEEWRSGEAGARTAKTLRGLAELHVLGGEVGGGCVLLHALGLWVLQK